ncbi:MAG TPA: gliding motility-associated C-terminal domain-containing protein [Puia sp.]|nr:gliding motility-associated C-terminal domain-containing protein [Puia sp.]
MKTSGRQVLLILNTILTVIGCFYYGTLHSQTCSGPTVKPTISIFTKSTAICPGSLVIFIATATNCGANPTYQWKINGIKTGNNSDTFRTSQINNGDVVSCTLTTDPAFACASPNKVSSYGIVMTVSASQAPSMTISASANDICPGTLVTFNSTTESTSTYLSFQWMLNQKEVSNKPYYATNSLEDGDEIYCILVDSGGCSTDPVNSNIISIIVKKLPLITLTPSDTSVAAGSMVQLKAVISGNLLSYSWEPSSGLSNASSLSPVTTALFSPIDYFFNAQTMDGCSVSRKISIHIFHDIIMPNAFTPNGDSHNDIFKIPANTNLQLSEFSIFDRNGNRVFTTSDIGKGWDGNLNGKKQVAGVYVYVIRGSDSKGKIISKGSFILVR